MSEFTLTKDGSAWFCYGFGFQDLQSSHNYTFGETRKEAIDSYFSLMIPRKKDCIHDWKEIRQFKSSIECSCNNCYTDMTDATKEVCDILNNGGAGNDSI